jgi:hypothetical protein
MKNWISTDDVVSISSNATIAIPGKYKQNISEHLRSHLNNFNLF